MSTEKVDHAINKGYPFGNIISLERFCNRVAPLIDMGNHKIQITVDPKIYPGFNGITKLMRLFAGSTIDFLLFRIFDYAEALNVAESQIKAFLQDEMPFIPEDFGFFKAVKPKDIKDNPAVIYVSLFDDSISMFRNNDSDFEWVIVRREEDKFKELKVQLPNHRIAYALFHAISIKVENKKVINSLSTNKFRATYTEPGKDVIIVKSFESTEEHALDDAEVIVRKVLKNEVNPECLMVEKIL